MRYGGGSGIVGLFFVVISIIYVITHIFSIWLDSKTWMTILVVCFFLLIGMSGLTCGVDIWFAALVPSITTIIYYLILAYTNWLSSIQSDIIMHIAVFGIIWFFGPLIGLYIYEKTHKEVY